MIGVIELDFVLTVISIAEVHAHCQYRQGLLGTIGFENKMHHVSLYFFGLPNSFVLSTFFVPAYIFSKQCINQPDDIIVLRPVKPLEGATGCLINICCCHLLRLIFKPILINAIIISTSSKPLAVRIFCLNRLY